MPRAVGPLSAARLMSTFSAGSLASVSSAGVSVSVFSAVVSSDADSSETDSSETDEASSVCSVCSGWAVPVWVELPPQAASERDIDSASSVARIFRIVMVCYLSSGEGDSGISWMVLPSRLIFPHCSSCSTARYKEVRPMLSISESLTIESPTLLPPGCWRR